MNRLGSPVLAHGSENVCRLASMMLQNPIRRVATLVLAAAMAVFLVPGLVLAHAELDTPTPADKSTVTTPVTEVSGTFIQRMKADGSTLVVKLVGGGTVAEGGVDPTDDKRMVATPTSPLGSGSYQVEWTTNSAEDNEVARGTWTFTVAVAAPSPTPAVDRRGVRRSDGVGLGPAERDSPRVTADPGALGRWQLHGERQ